MRSWSMSWLLSGVLACTSLVAPAAVAAASPSAAQHSTDAARSPREIRRQQRKRDRIRAVELQGLGMSQLLPRPGFGGDAAFVFGLPNFQARAGLMIVGVPPFRLGEGELANVLAAGQFDVCAAKPVLNHQIRMCVGGQAGGMAHRWLGYERPGRRLTPWASGTLKGDYQLKLTDHFGVIGGVGMVVPVVGPSFRAYNTNGSASPLIFPGPIAGFLSLGTTFFW